MKLTTLFTAFILILPSFLSAQSRPAFDDYFNDHTMRIDYYHIGDAESEMITLDHVYQYGIWAGSKKNLLENFDQGRYYIKIFDAASGRLIFSKGFDSYFGEYKTSGEAAEGIKRTYHETALIPYPKNNIEFAVERRKRDNQLEEIFRSEINPGDLNIIRDAVKDKSVKVIKSADNGDSHVKVDVVIIGEGYTAVEESKFRSDLKRFTEVLFKPEPYAFQKDKFNVYGIFKPSEDRGIDEPTHLSYKSTPLDVTFNSMGSERYILTENNKALRDLAAHAPYDAIYIMINHYRYGGGGIYNLFCTFTADNPWQEYLFVHEFGHSFAGLADEYYTSSVAYSDFYPRGIEPLEPNITALLDPESVKWKHLLSSGIKTPTPWEKQGYDESDLAWQKVRRELNNKIAELKRAGVSKVEIAKLEEEYNARDLEQAVKNYNYLKKSIYWGKVGAFEGAGYSSEGLYRPMLDCIMFSKASLTFCKVCEEAITKVIKYYSE
jgi:hypothetical protein